MFCNKNPGLDREKSQSVSDEGLVWKVVRVCPSGQEWRQSGDSGAEYGRAPALGTMAQEYSRVHDFFQQLNDLPSFANFDLLHAATAYELTSGADAGCAEAGALAPAREPPQLPTSHSLQIHQDSRKRKSPNFGEGNEMSGCEAPLPVPSDSTTTLAVPVTRKRKSSSYCTSSTYDDDGGDDSRSTLVLSEKKQNHSEIEKRRRDKMNTYITELSSMIPMCGAMARKLDKLTVLRMAVQHLRSVCGALTACPLTARPRPSFLSEKELNALVLHAARDCFLLVVGCDRGRLLYLSASVKKMLQYDKSELLGNSLFDILHPKDVAKVKEQLSSSDLSPRERLIDIKTMLPVKTDISTGASRFCPGVRRSFFCRIKCKAQPDSSPAPTGPVKEENETGAKIRKKHQEKKYCVVQCTGYLKLWTPVDISEGPSGLQEGGEETEGCNKSCLVAVGRALTDLAPSPGLATANPPTRQLQYVSRHATDGKFLFVDQRVTLALGFLPQELLGTSMYEYVSGPELSAVARAHKQALLRLEPLQTPSYSFRRKDGSLARIQTNFKPFKNPWTKEVECLVANNTIVVNSDSSQEQENAQTSFDLFKENEMPSLIVDLSDVSGVSETDVEMQRLIDSQVESHKIGSAIADAVLRPSSTEFSPDLPAELLLFNQQASSLVDNITVVDDEFDQVRNNVPLSVAEGATPGPSGVDAAPAGDAPVASPPLPPLGIDGNGEAAMAVIMSLLEADAGLGGPVNFSGLPWPLP